MEQEYTIDKKFPHVKIFVDKANELYIFKCNNCNVRLELAYNFAKYNDMKEEGEKFTFAHKNCIQKERPIDLMHEFKKDRHGQYKT